MKRSQTFLTLSVAVGLGLLALAPANAASPDAQTYHRAFQLLDSGRPDQAEGFARRGHDAILNKVLRAAYMAHPGNDVSFEEMAAFIAREPDWPNLKGIISIAEQKLPPYYSAGQIINWFHAHPPVSMAGFYHYIDALNAAGQTDDIATLIRVRWMEGDFSPDELANFVAHFPSYLGRNDNWARLDHLLWKGDVAGARRIYPYIDNDLRTVAEVRIALANQSRDAERLADRLPEQWQQTPGVMYERLRWRRRNNFDDAAIDILRHAPEDLDHADAWWEERQIMARRLMERRDYEPAYQLVIDHHATKAKSITQAEFLAGWLALRFLDDPSEAKPHFQALYDNASTPISRARGAYWLGRTCEALGDSDGANQNYETAAALDLTFYGQLAAAKLYDNPTVEAKPEPTIPAPIRTQFYNRDVVGAAEHLANIGEKDRARLFFRAELESATQRSEFALLTELAYRMNRPDLAIEAAKAANQKNMMIAAGGYPLLNQRVPKPPEPAFTHAVIRQESMFDADAESSAGARGLMQLMPGTAKGVASKLGIRFKSQYMTNPDFNLKLGTSFIQAQINDFDGSYILALAGYNAGPHRVREWMQQIGDPRLPNVDPIDWIEEIPVPETRNYVQRIIENLQVYRARLNGGEAPLLILKDLKR